MSESKELSHRAALMTGTAIKLLLIGARDEREINVGADLLSMELGKVGQQLQSLIGKLFTNIDGSRCHLINELLNIYKQMFI